MHNKLKEFEQVLEKDLKKEMSRIIDAGTVNPTEIKTINDAVCLMLKIKEYEEYLMEDESSEYSSAYNSMRGSYRRGRDSSTGQYVSREYGGSNRSYGNGSYGRSMRNSYENGYSTHSINDRMIDNLEQMMNQASGDYERQKIQEAMSMISGMSR